jgi:hypothetical protein
LSGELFQENNRTTAFCCFSGRKNWLTSFDARKGNRSSGVQARRIAFSRGLNGTFKYGAQFAYASCESGEIREELYELSS